MEPGYQKADTHNLPSVDVEMLCDFMASTASFSGVKAFRENDVCTVRGRVCPQHKVKQKPYAVACKIEEKAKKIQSINCLDCVASAGGCKHCIAFLMWLHRRSEEPAPTTVTCYWKSQFCSE
ncbi:hypothetical protein MML48_2g00016748 [Holotrichia oblita]|uniref:Uncharacterized protein n=1 Tax=Holotrichia oblita TaxID=644536 RepID=A0ACB9TMN5_HOLOL|nr:hypothetical protein MML48_2g00016748 [Holotrichia oblita]